MLGKQLKALGIDRVTIRITIPQWFHMGHKGSLNNVLITLNSKNPKNREDYWRRTFKTYSPFGLNVEDSVWPNLI